MKRKIILLIDDDEVFLMLTCRLLKDQPYLEHIETKSNADDALTYIQQLAESGAVIPMLSL